MNGQLLAATILTFAAINFAAVNLVTGQSPSPSPAARQQASSAQEEVVRVTTNLVQVDVVVTDKEGKQIVDLGPDDFEVQEDKRKQQITNFSYISTAPAKSSSAQTIRPTTGHSNVNGNALVAPASLRPEQERRIIALVVDDLGLSAESLTFVRQALKKLIDETMGSKDLVAVIRTGAGSGALQQFTSDRTRLYAAIENVQFNSLGRGGLDPFKEVQTSQLSEEFRLNAQRINEVEEERDSYFSVGTLGTLGFTIRGLADMPGRKAVVLISEAFRLFNSTGRNQRLFDAIRRLTDEANRTSVVIYTLDASGLQTLNLTASDKVNSQAYMFDKTILAAAPAATPPPLNTQRVDAAADAERDSQSAFRNLRALESVRNSQNTESQSVLSYLAQQTGGLYVHNRNDLGGGLRSIVADQQGYYLIGYRPEESVTIPLQDEGVFIISP